MKIQLDQVELPPTGRYELVLVREDEPGHILARESVIVQPATIEQIPPRSTRWSTGDGRWSTRTPATAPRPANRGEGDAIG
jgi:hypothetical protein